jgi:hypothetical protein
MGIKIEYGSDGEIDIHSLIKPAIEKVSQITQSTLNKSKEIEKCYKEREDIFISEVRIKKNIIEEKFKTLFETIIDRVDNIRKESSKKISMELYNVKSKLIEESSRIDFIIEKIQGIIDDNNISSFSIIDQLLHEVEEKTFLMDVDCFSDAINSSQEFYVYISEELDEFETYLILEQEKNEEELHILMDNNLDQINSDSDRRFDFWLNVKNKVEEIDQYRFDIMQALWELDIDTDEIIKKINKMIDSKKDCLLRLLDNIDSQLEIIESETIDNCNKIISLELDNLKKYRENEFFKISRISFRHKEDFDNKINKAMEENSIFFEEKRKILQDISLHVNSLFKKKSDLQRSKDIIEVNAVIEKYKDALIRKYKNLCYMDDYDIMHEKDFIAEAIFFAKHKFKNIETLGYNEISTMILSLVRDWANYDMEDTPAYNRKDDVESMSPIDYEHYCKDLLVSCGWTAYVTTSTGDQGADIIAKLGNIKIVIQCKLYSGPVGNKAVQEVISAKVYENANHSVVVTNSRFTNSARQLAGASNTLLIHHDDLNKLSSLLNLSL